MPANNKRNHNLDTGRYRGGYICNLGNIIMENNNFLTYYESISEFNEFAKPGDIFWAGYNLEDFSHNNSNLLKVWEVRQGRLIVSQAGQRKKFEFASSMYNLKVIRIISGKKEKKKPETLYRVEDYSGSTINLLADDSNDFQAKSNIDAARKYLKKKGLTGNLERTADNDVHIKVEPFYIAENGLKYQHPTKRISWYRLTHN